MKRGLILGGIRSGKSALAERLALASAVPVTFVATATAGDAEMTERIRRHQAERPADWGLVEEPLDLAGVLQRFRGSGRCLLIDCMSLWLSNLLHHAPSSDPGAATAAFCEAVDGHPDPLVIVSNEVGLGIIGMDPLTRRFADELGRLNQRLAARVDLVLLTVAGCPLVLKGTLPASASGEG